MIKEFALEVLEANKHLDDWNMTEFMIKKFFDVTDRKDAITARKVYLAYGLDFDFSGQRKISKKQVSALCFAAKEQGLELFVNALPESSLDKEYFASK